MAKLNKLMVCLTAVVLVSIFAIASGNAEAKPAQEGTVAQAQPKKFKAGFIYVGPVGDYGWSHAHDVGRRYVQNKFSWLETMYVEAIPEGDVPRVIDRLINEEKCDVVFTTSFGYMDATIEAGKRYPNKIFMHCSGYKQEQNVGSYFAEMYQMYYLSGLMAGALTKSSKIGYVGAHPIPEVVRHINAFAIGAKEVNPAAKVHVKWLFSWYDPARAREAAESLIAEGCDAFAFTEDSPAVIQVGKEHTEKGKQIYTFSHYSPMQRFGENTVVSGQLVDWGVMYEEILMRLYVGSWTNDDMLWFVKEKAVQLGGEFGQTINPRFIEALKAKTVNDRVFKTISVYDLVQKRLAQFKEPTITFDPFTGPIRDQKGNLWIKTGERGGYQLLWTTDWFVDNVVGRVK